MQVKVFHAVTGVTTLNVEVKFWRELKDILIENNLEVNGFVASESINKTTLESDDARIPQEDFILFLRQKDTKAGSLSRDELKSLLLGDNSDFKHYLKELGINWTTTSTNDLNNLYNDYLEECDENEDEEDLVNTDLEEDVSNNPIVMIEDIIDKLEDLKDIIEIGEESQQLKVDGELQELRREFEKFMATVH